MDFAELLEMLKNPGEDGIPDTIYDDLTNAYNSVSQSHSDTVAEYGAAQETWGSEKAAMEEEHASGRQALESEISRLKAMGFDALMSAPGAGNEEDSGNDSESGNEGEATEYNSVDDLFTTETKED